MSSAKRRLAVGAAGLAVLAGSGGAYAATQQNSSTTRPDPATEQKAFLDDLAKRLDVTRDKLDAALKGAASDRIDAAVAAGRLTQAQGDEAKKRIASGTGVPLPGFRGGGPGVPLPGFRGGGPGVPLPGFPGGGPGPHGPGGVRCGFGEGRSLSAAATFLGLTDSALRTQLESGKSLADVAKAQSKSTADLKAAMKTAITAELDKAVSDKRLTADQRTRILAEVDARLDQEISEAGPRHGPRHP
jgi:hypothetical protein